MFQILFLNPTISRRPKLQRQKKIFPKHKGKIIYLNDDNNSISYLFVSIPVMYSVCMALIKWWYWCKFRALLVFGGMGGEVGVAIDMFDNIPVQCLTGEWDSQLKWDNPNNF